MTDSGPPAPQPPPVIPQVVPPVAPVLPPAKLIVPPTQPIQPAPMQQLNWSHFKPKFTDKPDEDMEAHPCFPRRCQSPEFLFNICRRGKIMV